MNSITKLLATTTLIFTFVSCKKDTIEPAPSPAPNPTPAYSVPTTYTFSNADFNSSAARLSMLGEMITHIRASHTSTSVTQPTISVQKLNNMFQNLNSPFSDALLNSSGYQLKDKTNNSFSFVNEIEICFADAEAASISAAANPTVSTASNGVKGKLISPARAILVNNNGFEYKELVEKGMMGATLYHQAMTLLQNINSFDNTNPVNGITAQEKAWDEAFGYFGVPVAFPTSTTGLKYWGNYSNSVNSAIGSNALIMNAFLKGRAAISNKDAAGRDEAKTVVMNTWEKIAAAKCISYLKSAKNNLQDQATLHHVLSEAQGFILSFRYNPSKKIADTDISTLTALIGNNLYELVPANLDQAISKLESVFSLNAAQIP